MRLSLPDVTLVLLDTVCHELSALAVYECLEQADFGAVRVFSDKQIIDKTIYIDKLTEVEACNFAYHEMLEHIPTSHLLFIQWDSWIIDPAMWRDAFLDYDYIGAPWWYTDGFNVGNSGFNLRTKRLMQYVAADPRRFPIFLPEDELLCRRYRPMLPQFKWAPETIAQDFSFERSRPSISSRHFGFHGLFNWPFVLPPNRLDARMKLVRANSHIQQSSALKELDHLHRRQWIKPLAGVHIGSKQMEEV